MCIAVLRGTLSFVAQARQSPDAFLAAVAMAVRDALVAADGDGRIVLWAGGAEALLGWRADEVLGRPLTTIMPARFHAAHEDGFARVARGGPSALVGRSAVRVEARHRDGHAVPVELSLGRAEHEGAPAFVGVLRDLTERRAERERVELAESRFRAGFLQAPVGVALLGRDGRFADANPAFCALVGRSAAELLSVRFADLAVPDDRGIAARLMAALRAGDRDHGRLTVRLVRRDGRPVTTQVDVAVVRGLDGRADELLVHAHAPGDPAGFAGSARELLDATAVGLAAVREVDARMGAHEATITIADLGITYADPDALRELLAVLIGGAVAAADPDGPAVRVTAGTGPDGWGCTVADNGRGGPTGDAPLSERPGGAAARSGLAEAQDIVDRHGGRIWVRPAPGGGTEVRFVLPSAGA